MNDPGKNSPLAREERFADAKNISISANIYETPNSAFIVDVMD